MDKPISEILANVEGYCHSDSGLASIDVDSLRLLAAEVVRLDAIYGKLLMACIQAHVALAPDWLNSHDGESYLRCPACDRTGRTDSKIDHEDDCIAVFINRTLNDVECGSP